MLALGESARFHHVGVACRDLDAEQQSLAALGYLPEGADFTDPTQGVRGRFLVGGGPRLELLVADGPGGVLQPWLERGAKLYHMAWEVDALEPAIAALRAERARIVAGPVPAVAFGGRPIVFLMMPTMLLIELIGAEVVP